MDDLLQPHPAQQPNGGEAVADVGISGPSRCLIWAVLPWTRRLPGVGLASGVGEQRDPLQESDEELAGLLAD